MYLDTSAILKLYKIEAHSQELVRFVLDRGEPLALTALQELEFNNAIMLNQFQKNISDETAKKILARFRDDIQNRVYRRQGIEYPVVFGTAMRLACKYTSRLGGRSLDLLHVATCIELKLEWLVSFDSRQLGVAESVGLKTRTWS
jgi:predicted nucleic acid-binding protein